MSSLRCGESSASISSGIKMGPIWTLGSDECIDILENGPRLFIESLALLNDEEFILSRKAAYALDKVLGSVAVACQCQVASWKRAVTLFFVGFQNTDYRRCVLVVSLLVAR